MWSWERSTGKDSRGRVYKVRFTRDEVRFRKGDFQLVSAEPAVSKVVKPETLTVAIFTC